MKKLTSNIEVNSEKNIRRGNNPNGSPWIQYDMDDSYLKGNDEAFYRVDRNKDITTYKSNDRKSPQGEAER